MSTNENHLKRYLKKEETLNRNLIDKRKKRDSLAKQINRKSKKKKLAKSDISSISRMQKKLTDIESDITGIITEIGKNTKKINMYQERVDKEKQKEHDKLTKQLEKQLKANKTFVSNNEEVNQKLPN